MRVRANNASGGGGGITPTVVDSIGTKKRGESGTFTIDPTKDYLFIGDYKYSASNFQQEIQYIHNGTVTSLTNNYGKTYIHECTISGTTLTYYADTTGNVYLDYSLVQLN